MRDFLNGTEITPNPVQHVADGLTAEESSKAYKALADHFKLRAGQRTKLDRCFQYSAAINAAHRGDWRAADRALSLAGIIE